MGGFEGGDLGDGGEDGGTVGGCTLDAVLVVDASITRLLVQVELWVELAWSCIGVMKPLHWG